MPPAMIFPRAKFKQHMTNGAPVGTLGLANKSGWMTDFVKCTSTSVNKKSLLIYDNHESHLGPTVLKYAKENGVIILTLPPHCSDRLQPLDVSVYKSLKTGYNAAAASWMSAHPGQTLTIYEIANLFTEAFEKAMTPKNVKSGFRACGIFPLDSEIFQDDDFFHSSVTDRPAPAAESLLPANVRDLDESAAANNKSPLDEVRDEDLVLPEECIPLPKAAPRKTVNRQKKGKSMVATSTPEC